MKNEYSFGQRIAVDWAMLIEHMEGLNRESRNEVENPASGLEADE